MNPRYVSTLLVLTVASQAAIARPRPVRAGEMAQDSAPDSELLEEFVPLHRSRPGREPFRPFAPALPPARTGVSSISNPTAFGPGWGSAGIGIGYQERSRFTTDEDSIIGMSVGLGNPSESVGVQVSYAIVDVSEFDSGTLSVKLHRQLTENLWIAGGALAIAKIGDSDSETSVYGVVTHRIELRQDGSRSLSRLDLTLGFGDGAFRSEDDVADDRASVGVFASSSLRVADPVSLVVEWTGQDMTVGLGIVPFKDFPLTLTPALTDITGSAGDGTRFIFGVGVGVNF